MIYIGLFFELTALKDNRKNKRFRFFASNLSNNIKNLTNIITFIKNEFLNTSAVAKGN